MKDIPLVDLSKIFDLNRLRLIFLLSMISLAKSFLDFSDMNGVGI